MAHDGTVLILVSRPSRDPFSQHIDCSPIMEWKRTGISDCIKFFFSLSKLLSVLFTEVAAPTAVPTVDRTVGCV